MLILPEQSEDLVIISRTFTESVHRAGTLNPEHIYHGRNIQIAYYTQNIHICYRIRAYAHNTRGPHSIGLNVTKPLRSSTDSTRPQLRDVISKCHRHSFLYRLTRSQFHRIKEKSHKQ